MTKFQEELRDKIKVKLVAKTASNTLSLYLVKRALKTLGYDFSWRETVALVTVLRFATTQITEASEVANYSQRELRSQIRYAYGITDDFV